MATMQQEFDAGAALLELYKDLPYVRKVGYSIGGMAEHILVRVITDEGDCRDEDEAFANFLAAVRKSIEFEKALPPSMRDEYDVTPIVTSANEGALRHLRTMAVVIDR